MKRLYFNIDKENNKVILDRKDFDYLMSIGHYNDKAIEYIEQEKIRLAKEVSNTYIDTLDRTRLVNEDIYNELDEVLDILKGSDK